MAKSELSKKDYLDLLFYEPYKIGHWVGFEDLTELNNEWMRSFIYGTEDQTLLAHRGSYKTTSLSLAIGVIMILYPDRQIIFLRKTDTDVIEILRQVVKILMNPIMLKIVEVVHGKELKLTTENVGEINTNLNTSTRGGSQLIGMGILTSITGKHGDIIITDDIVNIKDRTSKAERDRTKTAYMELENIKNRGGRFINTGTPWHKEDAISKMPNVSKYDVYSTGLMDEEEIQELRGKMTTSLFSANYELEHISDENTMFESPVIDVKENVENIYNGIAHIDASYGGDDYTAFTILKEGKDGKLYVYGDLRESHVDDALHSFEAKREQYRAGTLYNEVNADKGYLAKKIRNPVKTYHEKMNKYIKISTFLRENWHRVRFVYDTSREYINQILDYNENAEHDDAPDSLASLIRIHEMQNENRTSGNVAQTLRSLGL